MTNAIVSAIRRSVFRVPALPVRLPASVGATQFVNLPGWLVYELRVRADLGLSSAAASLPNIVVSLFGGVIADRFDKRRIILSRPRSPHCCSACRARFRATPRSGTLVVAGARRHHRHRGLTRRLLPHLIERDGPCRRWRSTPSPGSRRA
jgi:hypothetical protein